MGTRREALYGEIFEDKFDVTLDDFQKHGVKNPMFPFRGITKVGYDKFGIFVDLDRFTDKVQETKNLEMEELKDENFQQSDLHKFDKEIPIYFHVFIFILILIFL